MRGELYSPLPGKIIPTSAVGDPVFSSGMLGEGFAVIPHEEMLTLRMPTNGRITSISDTSHAINILTDDGLELLIHVGIDTVELRGRGFELLCSAGDELLCGDPVMNIDFPELKRQGKDTVTPIIITNHELLREISPIIGMCNSNSVALRYRMGGV